MRFAREFRGQERTSDILDDLLILLRLVEVSAQAFVDDRDDSVNESCLSTDDPTAECLVDLVDTAGYEFTGDGSILRSHFVGHVVFVECEQQSFSKLQCSLANHPVLINE